jgi:hypothetical protein
MQDVLLSAGIIGAGNTANKRADSKTTEPAIATSSSSVAVLAETLSPKQVHEGHGGF